MKKIAKKIVEVLLTFFMVKDYQTIVNKIKKYNYVSFDIFDTLIKRNIMKEKDIFKIVQYQYNNNNNHKIFDFYQKRISAEITAKTKSNKKEITLDDIYNYIGYEEEICNELKRIELEVELSYTTKNNLFYRIYNYCLENNKKIIITSDMYLDSNFIEEILNKNGYNKYNKIYVSSVYNATKSKGELFKYIIKDFNINSREIVHIGDNPISDYIMPKRNGINAILIKKDIFNTYYYDKKECNNNLQYNIMTAKANNMLNEKSDFFYNIGCCILGPLLLGFCTNLHKYISTNNISNIFFLSRDAKIIMDVYMRLYPKEKDNCKYMYISRKSVTLLELKNTKNADDFEKVIGSVIKRRKVSEILSILELDSEKYIKKLENENIDSNLIYEELTSHKKTTFYNIIKNEMIVFSEKQNEYFKDYLQQIKFVGDLCLVDIGWKGTIQTILESFCKRNDIDCNINGYYFGIYKSNERRHGFIYNNSEINKYKVYFSVGFFESMFINDEGSTLYYKKSMNIIQPVKGTFEQTGELRDKVKNMQNAAIDFCIGSQNLLLDITSHESFFNYDKVVACPNIKFLNKIKNIKFYDNKIYTLLNNKSIFYYIIHLGDFKIDLLNSYYKIGMLKNIFKINLPYFTLLKKIYDKYKSNEG